MKFLAYEVGKFKETHSENQKKIFFLTLIYIYNHIQPINIIIIFFTLYLLIYHCYY